MEYFLYILLAIIVLLAMITIHELGHYIAGKILKFKINEFSIGLGPKIFSKTNKKTGEVFSLRVVPLGGYCAFEGETDVEEEEGEEEFVDPDTVYEELEKKPVMPPCVDPLRDKENAVEQTRSFIEEKPWKRLIVLVSGALFNFISAIIFSIIVICVVGYSVPTVTNIYTDATNAPYCTELQVGDKILAVDGQEITVMTSYEELVTDKSENKEYTFLIERNGEQKEVKVKVQRIVGTDGENEFDYMGIGFVTLYAHESASFWDALVYCVPYTLELSFSILKVFGGLFTGSVPLTSVTGPVGTVDTIAQLGMLDWRNILILLPLIASNLAIFNVLPIPALDGSKLIFTTIEWIRKKPINRKVENIIHAVGMILLLGFIVVIDIIGLFT